MIGATVSLRAPSSIFFHLYVWATWLERLSPHLMPDFFKRLGKASFLSSPLQGCPSGSSIYWFISMDVSCCSTALPTGGKKWSPPSAQGAGGGAHIKIAFRGNFHEDKILTQVVVVCRFSIAAWQSIACIEMWWNTFNFVDDLKYQACFWVCPSAVSYQYSWRFGSHSRNHSCTV